MSDGVARRLPRMIIVSGSLWVDPADRDAYLEGCRLDEDEATLDRAEACYRRAITLDPALANALTNLGNLRFRRGDSAH